MLELPGHGSADPHIPSVEMRAIKTSAVEASAVEKNALE
jgi:hypothetical protein